MAPPNNPAVAKVAFVGNRDTRQWVNVFHAHKTTGEITLQDMGALASAMFDWWNTQYRQEFGPSVVLDVIQVRKLDPLNPLALDYTTGLPLGGARTGGEVTMNPGNVSLTLSWRTGLAGRKFRGRTFIPGLPLVDTTTIDTINSGTVARLSAIAASFMTHVLNSGLEPVVFHQVSNVAPTLITNFVIDAILDSMRSRLPGRGR